MARRAIVEPNTVEYLTAKGILGSKERAYRLVMENPDLPESGIIKLAREWKTSLDEVKAEKKLIQAVSQVDLRENWQDFIFQARPMTLCGFPHKRTDATRVTRLIPMGPGTVGTMSFSAMKEGVPLPSGITDRAVFDALCTLAVTQKSRVLEMDTLDDFIEMVFPGLSDAGSRWKRGTGSIQRLVYCGVLFEMQDGKQVFSSVQGLIGAAHLPSFEFADRLSRGEQPLEFEEFIASKRKFRIILDESFFNTLVLAHQAMPYPTEYLRQFMDDTLTYDLAKFLPARIHAARGVSKIPIVPFGYTGVISLQDQLGSSDSNKPRFREKVQESVRRIKEVWKGCSAEVNNYSLVINPITRDNWLVQPKDCTTMDTDMLNTISCGV